MAEGDSWQHSDESTLPLHARRLRRATVSLPPGECRDSWKIRRMKGGAKAPLSIHALPAASPARRSMDKHIHAGHSPRAASHPRDMWLLSTPQIALKDVSRTDFACSSGLSCQTNTRQEGRLLEKTQLWLFCFGLLWRLNGSCSGQNMPHFQAQLRLDYSLP